MMTRLRMKHYFYTVLLERMEVCRAEARPLSVMMLDIDHFKVFNDTNGHQAGDVALKSVAQLIQKLVRNDDVAARFGGEEFIVLLPDLEARGAVLVAERIRAAIQSCPIVFEGKKLQVTISIGIAEFDPARDASTKQLVERADKALYISKSGGRNRTSVSD
jgi:diguanylate cyclase (GGDEF)-like protein